MRAGNGPHKKKPVLKLSETDKVDDIIYCPTCKSPVVDSEYGVRRHMINNPVCAEGIRDLGYSAEGKKTQ
jgi:hypothetical protein